MTTYRSNPLRDTTRLIVMENLLSALREGMSSEAQKHVVAAIRELEKSLDPKSEATSNEQRTTQ